MVDSIRAQWDLRRYPGTRKVGIVLWYMKVAMTSQGLLGKRLARIRGNKFNFRESIVSLNSLLKYWIDFNRLLSPVSCVFIVKSCLFGQIGSRGQVGRQYGDKVETTGEVGRLEPQHQSRCRRQLMRAWLNWPLTFKLRWMNWFLAILLVMVEAI